MTTENTTTEPVTLTAAGRRWAERNALHSMLANVALHGYSTGWPATHIEAARTVANEEGAKS